MTGSYKYIDFTYLRDNSDGSPEFIIEMLTIFKEEIPSIIDKIKFSLKTENWTNLGEAAHKSKSMMSIVGMHVLIKHMNELEIFCKKQINIEKYPEYSNYFLEQIDLALIEIDQIIKQLSGKK